MKKEQEDWTKTYHKILKGLEVMINVQRMMKDIKKIVGEVNMTITEMEKSILSASINNRMTNATNISEISENLWYLVQCNMEDQVFQIQRMLVDKLDKYKERDNAYVDNNISEIQKLYINKEQMKKSEGRVEEEEVILIKPYKVSESTSTKSSSFIDEEINNLLKYMKFIKFPTQTRIF